MPKIVDHEERKQHIAEATWRVITSQGIQGASVRKIAGEAGLSLGALRHYFSTQQDLLEYAMNLVKERARARIDAIIAGGAPPKQKIVDILMELVPTDGGTLVEMEVWLAFTFHRKFVSKASFDALHDGIFDGMKNLVAYMAEQRMLQPELDPDFEAERLYALVDGLALHATLDPRRLGPERVKDLIMGHMDSIWR